MFFATRVVAWLDGTRTLHGQLFGHMDRDFVRERRFAHDSPRNVFYRFFIWTGNGTKLLPS